MNTESENNSLQGSFGDRGTNVNAIAYGHPHADKIIEEAIAVIQESSTGQNLLKVMYHFKIPVQILKGKGESETGFSPDMGTIFLQAPGKTEGFYAPLILSFIKGLREADQHHYGLKSPDPMEDVMAYAAFMHARNIDGLYFVCEVLKELTNSSYFPVLLDSLKNLGLNSFYIAHSEGATKEELYENYAEAYNRGSTQ